jgi:AP-4 complex subunit mu-1
MKSFLHGNPGLRLVLNDNLFIGKGAHNSAGNVILDDCAFHESVDTRDFDALKTLAINPPDGEFLVMNYRINADYQTPFSI